MQVDIHNICDKKKQTYKTCSTQYAYLYGILLIIICDLTNIFVLELISAKTFIFADIVNLRTRNKKKIDRNFDF